jgi:hypothetical protein
MKLRNLFYVLLALPLFFVSCTESGTDEPATQEPTLTLISNTTLSFDADGGDGSIVYIVENPVDGAKVTASCNANWITNLTVGDIITFKVEANTGEDRSTVIVAIYKDKYFEVAINQAAKSESNTPDNGDNNGNNGDTESVSFTAKDAYAIYYGEEYSPGVADNYYLILSDLGFDNDGYEYPGGTYYIFDIFAPITPDMTITSGTYILDNENTCESGTVTVYYSEYYVINATGDGVDAEDYPDSGYITFSDDGSIYAEIHLTNSGATHKISYTGDIYIDDIYGDYDDGDGNDGSYSTLTDDHTCLLDNHTLYYIPYGDYYGIGLDNYTLYLEPNDYDGDCMMFELFTSGNDFAGTYAIDESMGAYTIYPGYIEEYYGEYYMVGTWYYTGDYENMAAIIDGNIVITKNSNDTYTVSFETYDELSNCIDGTWTGTAIEYVDSYAASNAKRLSKSLVVEQKATPKKMATPKKGLKLR